MFDDAFDRSISECDLACDDHGGAAVFAVLGICIALILGLALTVF